MRRILGRKATSSFCPAQVVFVGIQVAHHDRPGATQPADAGLNAQVPKRRPDSVDLEDRRLVYDGFFKVEEADLRYERYDGTMSERVRRLNLDRGVSVAVLLLDHDQQEILLVEQFKYPAWTAGYGWIVEVVAGIVDDGETPEDAARREVFEETGYSPGDLQHIASFFVSPGGSSERVILYYAEVGPADHVAEGGGRVAEGEDICLRRYSFMEAWAAADRGEIADAKTLLALAWLRRRLGD
jgi:nudix-type nucleoside diphosphatase (YffH/AdpP family)